MPGLWEHLGGEDFAFVLSQVWPAAPRVTIVCIQCGQTDKLGKYPRGLCSRCYDHIRRTGGDIEQWPTTYHHTGRETDGIRLAVRLGVSYETLRAWRAARIPKKLTIELAQNLEAAFGVPAELWLAAYKLSKARHPCKANTVSATCSRGHQVLDPGPCKECKRIKAVEKRAADPAYNRRRCSPDFVPAPWHVSVMRKDIDEDRLLALAKQGWQFRDLAKEFGVSPQTVSNRLARLGFRTRRPVTAAPGGAEQPQH